MPTYVTLAQYTDQGIRRVRHSPARLEGIKKLVADHGRRSAAMGDLTVGSADGWRRT